jgi:hypothetical protein
VSNKTNQRRTGATNMDLAGRARILGMDATPRTSLALAPSGSVAQPVLFDARASTAPSSRECLAYDR